MEQSLSRQRASVEAFQQNMTSRYGGWKDAPLALASKATAEVAPSALSSPPQAELTVADNPVPGAAATEKTNKGFFRASWPDSIPLAVPNVQVINDNCDPLESNQIDTFAEDAGKRQGIDAMLLKSVMKQESGNKPCALSVSGAMGLMQIMPETAEMLGLDDPFDGRKNVDAGAKYLRMMLDRYQGDVRMALGAYNAGPGRVDRAGGVPAIPETIDYISKVLRSMPAIY